MGMKCCVIGAQAMSLGAWGGKASPSRENVLEPLWFQIFTPLLQQTLVVAERCARTEVAGSRR